MVIIVFILFLFDNYDRLQRKWTIMTKRNVSSAFFYVLRAFYTIFNVTFNDFQTLSINVQASVVQLRIAGGPHKGVLKILMNRDERVIKSIFGQISNKDNASDNKEWKGNFNKSVS